MGRVEFDEGNKSTQAQDFPKFRLEKKDDRARIVCLENPVQNWVHEVRAPKIVNGEAVMGTYNRKDGSTYEDYVKDFLGRPLCVGDEGAVKDRGSDPANCPLCAAAREFPDYFSPPARRFAMHIIQYGTRPGSFDLRDPFSVETRVWSFADRYFNKLVDFKTLYGNLQGRDILVTCTNPAFQTYDFMVADDAQWTKSDERKQTTATTFRENQAPDLDVFCGRRQERRWMLEDIERVKDRWRTATGRSSASSTADKTQQAEEASLAEGLGDLLAGITPKSEPATPTAAPTEADVSDLLGSLEVSEAPAVPTPESAESPESSESSESSGLDEFAAPKPTDEKVDFSDLLNLGVG